MFCKGKHGWFWAKLRTTLASAVLICVSAPSGAIEFDAVVCKPTFLTYAYLHGGSSSGQYGSYFVEGRPGFGAMMWKDTPASVVDLHPMQYFSSQVSGGNAEGQYGFVVPTEGAFRIAYKWNGSKYGGQSVAPPGVRGSEILGVRGQKKIGYVILNGSLEFKACVWLGNTDSAQVLEGGSVALDAVNDVVVGASGYNPLLDSGGSAKMWKINIPNPVNLHPSGAETSIAYSTWGDNQYGVVDGKGAIWKGTAASVQYVSFPGYEVWRIYSANEYGWVGKGFDPVLRKEVALYWDRKTGKLIDLSKFLPDSTKSSHARSIDERGYIAGQGLCDSATGTSSIFSVVWKPVNTKKEKGS